MRCISTTKIAFGALALLTGGAALAGCMAEGDAPDAPATAEADQPVLLSQNPFSIGWTGGHHEWDMGPSSTQTCLLTSVKGDLSGDTSYGGNIAEAGTAIKNGRWVLIANAGVGTGVALDAMCIQNVTNRTQISASECTSFNCISPSVAGTPSFPNRRCFVNYLWSRAGMTFHYQGDSAPGLHVTQAGDGRFYLQTWSSDDAGEASNMGGTVTCVDIAGDAPGSWSGANHRVCAGSVTRGFFTGIFGDFNGSLSNGVIITNDLANGGASVAAASGKTAEFDCVW
jgi:hypothetical protein